MNPHEVIALDTESFYSPKLKYSLTTMIGEQYARHSLFHVYMVSASDGEKTFAGSPSEFDWSCLAGRTVVMHNKAHDWTMLAEMERRGQIPAGTLASIKDCYCTAAMSAFLCNRRSLADAVEYLLKIKVDKTARKDAANKHWPQDFSEQERATMTEYAGKDAHYTWQLWNKFSSQWPAWERKLSNLTIEQGMRGVQIDTALLDQYLLRVFDMKAATEKVLPWLDTTWDADDEFTTKPTSTKCIAENCRRVGIPAPPVKSDDEEAYETWEATYSPAHPWITAVSSWRSINKLATTFATLKARLRDDGTAPFSLRYCGAHTKRWSGEAKINFQNMRKKPILCNESGLMEIDESRIDAALKTRAETGSFPEWVRGDVDFRRLIIARPGKRLVISDLAAIEPRVLAHLCGNTALLDLIAGGMSVYEAYGRSVLGYTGAKVDKNGSDYKLWKASILGLGYGCGSDKFIAMAKTLAGLDITASDPEWITILDPVTGELKKVSGYGTNSKRIVAEFRAANPKIVALWQQLEAAFRRSVGEDFTLVLPSGNRMTYEKVRAEVRIELDPVSKKPRRKTVFTAAIGGRRTITWGSRLVENLIQATARDVLADQMVSIAERGWTILFSAHDELILEVDNFVSVDDVAAAMSRTPDFLRGCPIAAVAHEATNYAK